MLMLSAVCWYNVLQYHSSPDGCKGNCKLLVDGELAIINSIKIATQGWLFSNRTSEYHPLSTVVKNGTTIRSSRHLGHLKRQFITNVKKFTVDPSFSHRGYKLIVSRSLFHRENTTPVSTHE